MGTDLSQLTSWNAPWKGVRVAVFGAGASGFSVADTLNELECAVLVGAREIAEDHKTMMGVLGVDYFEAGEEETISRFTEFKPDFLVAAPGICPNNPVLLWAAEANVPIMGDIELAWRLRDKSHADVPWVLITGTNGKTTTTELVEHVLNTLGYPAVACGNYGRPILDVVRLPEQVSCYVVEISSFQLHWINIRPEAQITPYASVCLNIAEDHVDWHGSFERYSWDKAKVYANTSRVCIYNKADEKTIRMVENADVIEGARAIGFTLGAPAPGELGIIENMLVDRAFVEDPHNTAVTIIELADLEKTGLLTPHNVANTLAAAAIVRSFGIKSEDIAGAIDSFRMSAHRQERIATIGEVLFVNDSKATNAHAADAALASYESVVWIVGGLFKGQDITELVKKHAKKLRGVILIGREKDDLREIFQRHAPSIPQVEVETNETELIMVEVVQEAVKLAEPGDVVLLAPATASMDQFKDYAERGDLFRKAVQELEAE